MRVGRDFVNCADEDPGIPAASSLSAHWPRGAAAMALPMRATSSTSRRVRCARFRSATSSMPISVQSGRRRTSPHARSTATAACRPGIRTDHKRASAAMSASGSPFIAGPTMTDIHDTSPSVIDTSIYAPFPCARAPAAPQARRAPQTSPMKGRQPRYRSEAASNALRPRRAGIRREPGRRDHGRVGRGRGRSGPKPEIDA